MITTSATVHTPAKSAAAGESTAAITVSDTRRPNGCKAALAYAREDAAVFAGLDSALRMNLRDALQSELDDYILNSTDKGLLQFGTDPTNPADETTAAEYIATLYENVDGSYATST